MKFIIIAVLVAVSVAIPVVEQLDEIRPSKVYEPTGEDFAAWAKAHNKVYASDAEKVSRFEVWKANVEYVNKENQAGNTYRLAANKFADMSNTEYRMKMLGYKPTGPSRATGTFVPSSNDLPAAVDWRSHKPEIIGPVKDQGQCGSCWAFSAIATSESAINLKNSNQTAYKRLELSEQELVDCVDGGADDCNTGGEMYKGLEYAISAGGLETEAKYPYTESSEGKCHFKKASVAATLSGYLNVTSGDEVAMAHMVAEHGVVSVGIDASSQSFQFYDSGIYRPKDCSSVDLDHGVSVVGYRANKAGKGMWIMRNSWGEGWGIDGYMHVAKDHNNMCGIATQVCVAVA